MNRFVRVLVLVIFCMSLEGGKVRADEPSLPEYLKYVSEVTKLFEIEMKKKYNLHCSASGGRMPYDVEEIDLSFTAYRSASIEEARKMEVDATETLVRIINSHEKIRPFLRNYPFDYNRAGVTIAFRTREGRRPLDGSVVLVGTGKGKIYYDKAEMRKEIWPGMIDCSDPNNVIEYPDKEVEIERLITIFEEPYEEALKMVQESSD